MNFLYLASSGLNLHRVAVPHNSMLAISGKTLDIVENLVKPWYSEIITWTIIRITHKNNKYKSQILQATRSSVYKKRSKNVSSRYFVFLSIFCTVVAYF